MGATESVFYDDAQMEGLPRPMVAEPPPLPPSDRKTRPRPTNGEDVMRRNQQQPQLQKPPQRRRPPAQAKPIKRMEGLVMGGPKTGKRTLLSRLKGVDPFAKKGQANKAEEEKEENPSITIQYKPPSESPTWDRIKLRIRYANSIEETSTPGKKENNADSQIDFVVLMISPKDSRETTQSYLEGILDTYLDRLGYRKAAGNDDENEERKTDALALAPFCIAILFNFRDLEQGQAEEKDAPVSKLNLRRIVDNTLRSRNVQERKIVVECLETSLLNCYGLDGLHRFIYRTYLQRCQTDIERQLDVVRNQIQLTEDKNRSKNGEKTIKDKVMSYDEFLKENAPKEEVAPPPQRQKKESAMDNRRKEEPVARRAFGPKQTQTLRMGKDALEAFLASSSDEEETKQPVASSRRPKFPNTNGYDSSSSDDDSDDDFFYDESGNRRHQIHNQTPTKTAIRTEIANDESSNSSTSEDDDEDRKVSSLPKATPEDKSEELEQKRKETAMQETETVKSCTVELEDEVVDDEDENEDDAATNEIETHDDTMENIRKEIHSVVEHDIADTNDTDDNSLSENSRVHTNEEVADDSDEINHDDTVNPDIDDTAANGENDDDIPTAETSSLHSEQDDDEVASSSTPVVQNDLEDNDDDDDDDDGYMINSAPDADKAVEDNVAADDDDDDDDYMIQSTPDANEVSQGDSDDDDDNYMINSTPAIQQVAEDEDDDDDDYMIGATSTSAVVEDDDDDDDGFVIGHTPVSGGNAADEDDSDNEFMIEANVTEDGNENIDNSPDIQPVDDQSTEKTSPSQPATDSGQTPPKAAASGGISQAALAAIAAAQEEAEAMMRQQQQQQYSEIQSKEKKSKKKKTDEKKKKKKKKAKSSDE